MIAETNLPKKINVKKGFLATGDNFISDKSILRDLKELIPEIDAVEMEGAAIAQIATQENVPWLVVRTISDSADDEASQDFTSFLERYKKLSWFFIKNFLESC